MKEKIIRQVSQYYNTDILLRTRKKSVSFPRAVAMYLICVFTDLTMAEIGREFGKDHSSVIYSNKKIRAFCLNYPDIRKQVIELETVFE